jgi:hypothetical protein
MAQWPANSVALNRLRASAVTVIRIALSVGRLRL